MKIQIITMLAIVTITSTSFGLGNPPPTKRDSHRKDLVCSAKDDGWEEHLGGHNSCGECLSKHGGCYLKCSEVSYTCTAKGTDANGTPISIEANGPDRYNTADEALRRCQNLGGRDCRASTYSDCNEVLNEVSRTRCERSSAMDKSSTKIGSESYLFASHVEKESASSTSDSL